MKKQLILTLAVSLASATQMMAANYDLFITGSTAFRTQVYNACSKLYDNGAPVSIAYGLPASGGNSPQGTVSKNTQWTMFGSVSNLVSSIGVGNTLTIHAFFTGSVQGMQTVEQEGKIVFVDASGNVITNTPTIAYSDVDSSSTPYPTPGEYSDCGEVSVAVQPFVMCKSAGTSPAMSAITNVTWDDIRSMVQPGRLPLSAWTHNPADHNNYVYLVQRTKDSGTRRTELAEVQFPYNESASIYLYDNVTNNIFYKPTGTVIVGGAGNSANLNWGSGYVAGSDVATELNYGTSSNQAIAILSLSDAKSITGSATANNWTQVLPFNNVWPTASGAGISGYSGSNDFSPVIMGTYPLWAYEQCIYPIVAPSSRASGDQDLSLAQLGDTSTTGSILNVLNHVAVGTPIVGSIENEILTAGAGGATAIRINDMTASRSSVGGTITP